MIKYHQKRNNRKRLRRCRQLDSGPASIITLPEGMTYTEVLELKNKWNNREHPSCRCSLVPLAENLTTGERFDLIETIRRYFIGLFK